MSTQEDIELVRAIRGDSTAKNVVFVGFAWAGSAATIFLCFVRYLRLPAYDVVWTWLAAVVAMGLAVPFACGAYRRTAPDLSALDDAKKPTTASNDVPECVDFRAPSPTPVWRVVLFFTVLALPWIRLLVQEICK